MFVYHENRIQRLLFTFLVYSFLAQEFAGKEKRFNYHITHKNIVSFVIRTLSKLAVSHTELSHLLAIEDLYVRCLWCIQTKLPFSYHERLYQCNRHLISFVGLRYLQKIPGSYR